MLVPRSAPGLPAPQMQVHFAPPVLIERPGLAPLPEAHVKRVATSYLHPIIFPKNYGHPQRIKGYFKRLSEVADQLHLWELPEAQATN